MPIIKKIRRKRSIFCQNKKNELLIDAGVFSNEGVWVLCKGRPYCDGKFRCSINGKELVVHRNRWIPLEDPSLDEAGKQSEICRFNCAHLEAKHPLKKNNHRFDIHTLVNRYVRVFNEAPLQVQEVQLEPPHQMVNIEILPDQV